MQNKQRFIDANAIEVPKYKTGMFGLFKQGYYQGKTDGIIEVKALAPTVDAVEVVRCGDCKFFCTPGCPMTEEIGGMCFDDFCSCGERRVDE